jgi:hypothetical protein
MSAKEITRALKGQWLGRYGVVRCPAHDDKSPSLQISDGGADVTVHCHAGCDFRAVRDALRSLGLLNGLACDVIAPSVAPPTDDRADDHDRIERARAIWKASRPIAGTLAEKYLRSRGIRIPLPSSLRFHPRLKDPHSPRCFPAMVAGVCVWPSRSVVAVHRTFLNEDGTGKAPIMSPKCMLGPVKGGAVRLGVAAPLMALCEGIESSLSFLQSTAMPTWACLSTTGLRGVVLPDLPQASEVVIGADNDSPGLAAANNAAAMWSSAGRVVRIATPPIAGQDFNDMERSAA